MTFPTQEPTYPPKPEKICSDCIYKGFEYAIDVDVVADDTLGRNFIPVCNYPLNIKGYNVVDGKRIYINPSCYNQRRSDTTINQCGLAGNWFKRKESTAVIKDPAESSVSKKWDL